MSVYKWKKVPLDQVACIQTGLAKGKKNINNPVSVPYLRVANVQDGYLDLSLIKKIEIGRDDIHRYSLKCGDVLLTEGGDFDKLGRGAIWQGDIDPCLHQNHIFVVRPQTHILTPEFLSLLIGSSYGKAYFLKCSKQSTNLASINSSQLKKFPVLLPPKDEQVAIADLCSARDHAIEKAERLITAKGKWFLWLIKSQISDRCIAWEHIRVDKIFASISDKGNAGAELLSVTQDRGVIPRKMLEGRVMSPESSTDSYKLIKEGDFAISLRF